MLKLEFKNFTEGVIVPNLYISGSLTLVDLSNLKIEKLSFFFLRKKEKVRLRYLESFLRHEVKVNLTSRINKLFTINSGCYIVISKSDYVFSFLMEAKVIMLKAG